MRNLTISRPDDCHVHLRDGIAMAAVVADTAKRFARAIVMPNLEPPVVTTAQALKYRERILSVLPPTARFSPLMTLYLTDNTSVDEIARAKKSGHIFAVKYYPRGATTHSDAGVMDISKVYSVLEAMVEHDLPLLVHGELIDETIDIFDRERLFIDRVLMPLLDRFRSLRVVFEHITTREAVQFVMSGSDSLAATITPHHLLLNRNALFEGGLQPHHYCHPMPKRENDRQALVEAATSGNPKLFLGTDSAPHSRSAKEGASACAGIYSANSALELYAEVFDEAGAIDRLEEFASVFGAAFYRLPRNTDRVTLRKDAWTVPQSLPLGDDVLVPFRAGHQCAWKLVEA